MQNCKKLIEVAMPIKEISAESVRDKSIRTGHISTLHLWWARRPLPACRAIVFASLIPDPLDENCPQAFREAIEILLGKDNNLGDPYKPYDDIPYTAAVDKMEDNHRNRLLMFIGKFSDRYALNERLGRKTDAKDQISDSSLIKWENKNSEVIIGKARKLIWVAHNSEFDSKGQDLLTKHDLSYKNIIDSESDLYQTVDRHLKSDIVITKELKLKAAINSYLEQMPKVFDPFAGGGAIPLEAARLGCVSYGNDINPVAHIIQKGSIEFPQKYGKPISYSKVEFENKYGRDVLVEWCKLNNKHADTNNLVIEIANRLSYDLEYYAKKLLAETEKEVGQLYPKNDKGEMPLAYYWTRIGTCSNPSCQAEVPLLRQFYLSQRRGTTEKNWVHFKPIIKGNQIELDIQQGKSEISGWLDRANLTCPICGNVTDVKKLKEQFVNRQIKEKLVAVIEDSVNGKSYRKPNEKELIILTDIQKVNVETPSELMPENDSQNVKIPLWGFKKWGDMFSHRQLLFQYSLLNQLEKLKHAIFEDDEQYRKSIITYLAILIDRISVRNNSFCRWHIQQDTIEHPFSRQAIPMMFDFPEMNPFADFSGSAKGQLQSIIDVINKQGFDTFASVSNNSSSGEKNQFPQKFLDVVVTDPPYYDAIAYADLSDFFYIWLKRMLSGLYPLNFATPQTPKTEECTAIKHHHDGDIIKAKQHFEKKLFSIFHSIEHQTKDLVSIMFAHQSTEAWTTLCNSILRANMNITGSWAIDTEMAVRMLSIGNAALESSVTVSCRPSRKEGYGNYKDVRNSIDKIVAKQVNALYHLGFRGADLLTACFGQAVSEFGRYEKVEKADGSEVTVTELLEMAKESAFNSLLKGFEGDDFTKFYIGWLQLYGFAESDFDDAAKFSRVGLTINVSDLFTHNIFIKKGSKQELAGFKDRLIANKRVGDDNSSFIIDRVHRGMSLYSGTNRGALLNYISKVAESSESSFWRVVTSLCEVLPQGSEDFKQAIGLLLNKDSLIRESKNIQQQRGAQGELF